LAHARRCRLACWRRDAAARRHNLHEAATRWRLAGSRGQAHTYCYGCTLPLWLHFATMAALAAMPAPTPPWLCLLWTLLWTALTAMPMPTLIVARRAGSAR